MKAIDRLYKYLEYKGIKPTRLEKEIGLSNGYLGTQLKRNADLGESAINKIIDYCLDLSELWFITGKGEMLKAKGYSMESGELSKIAEAELTNYKNGIDAANLEAASKEELIIMIKQLIEVNNRNSISIEKMVETADRNSITLSRLVDVLYGEGIKGGSQEMGANVG